MFISEAFAAASSVATESNPGDLTKMILQFAVILGIFYFFLIRPQTKKLKLHDQMIAGAEKGNKVITNGGIIGRVVKVEETELLIEIAEGVKVWVLKEKLHSVSDFEKSDKAKIAVASSANSNDEPKKAKKSEKVKEILK